MSAPFILGPGEQHPEAPKHAGPFLRFASGQTDGLATLAEIHLQPLTRGPNLHVHTREDELSLWTLAVQSKRVHGGQAPSINCFEVV